MKELLQKLKNRPLIDVWHYLVGNYRYRLFYSKFRVGIYPLNTRLLTRGVIKRHPLMRQHIWEQIKFRITHMDKDCYTNGECKLCGCQTTHLQMCNKPCDKPCYPPMLSKTKWKGFITKGDAVKHKGLVYIFNGTKNKIVILKETINSYVQINRD